MKEKQFVINIEEMHLDLPSIDELKVYINPQITPEMYSDADEIGYLNRVVDLPSIRSQYEIIPLLDMSLTEDIESHMKILVR